MKSARDTKVTSRHTDWYEFHFGSEVVNSSRFDPASFATVVPRDCYVLFADLCSFTAFSRATESVQQVGPLMMKFYSLARRAILKGGGMLAQIQGDGVVAVWGLHSNQNDYLRLMMNAAVDIARIGNEVAAEWQASIDLLVEPKGVRLGMSNGPIIAVPRDRSYQGLSLLGNPLNLAARLQSAASANQLVCANVVYEQLKGIKMHTKLRPYKDSMGASYIDAKNYGRVKAWVLDMK